LSLNLKRENPTIAVPFTVITAVAYPKDLRTLGDHLRKRRLDLGLLQREAAERIGVHKTTVWLWERNRATPEARYVPAIIRFLGYMPPGLDASFPEALRSARRAAGLTQRQLAKRAHVDASSIRKWELGQTRPLPATVQRLSRFFTKMGWPLPDFEPETLYGPEHRVEAARRAWGARSRQPAAVLSVGARLLA